MNKEFVTYEIAKKLKEKGFDESCFGWYNYQTIEIFGVDLLLDSYAGEEDRPLAPLWQQAIEWFRDNHGIYIVIDYDLIPNMAKYKILKENGYKYEVVMAFGDYNKARQSAIEESLKLI